MTIDCKQFESYRRAFPEDSDRMSFAARSAEFHGMTEEFNYLLGNSLDIGQRANWANLLSACGGTPDHNHPIYPGNSSGSRVSV